MLRSCPKLPIELVLGETVIGIRLDVENPVMVFWTSTA